MKGEFFVGLLFFVCGAIMLVKGLKDKSPMSPMKFRWLLTAGAAMFFGFIFMIRS